MKKSKITLVVAIFLGVIALLASSYVVYDVFIRKEDVKEETKGKEENLDEVPEVYNSEKLDLNSDLVQKLFKFTLGDNLEIGPALIVNGDSKNHVEAENLSDEAKSALVYNAIPEEEKTKDLCSTTSLNEFYISDFNTKMCCGSSCGSDGISLKELYKTQKTETIKLKTFEKYYREFFGKDAVVPTKRFRFFQGGGYIFIFDKVNETFYNYDEGTARGSVYHHDLINAYKLENKITLVVKRFNGSDIKDITATKYFEYTFALEESTGNYIFEFATK
ncbi:MAG: hypothetical protein RSG95_00200 [Bacilli bacterium]